MTPSERLDATFAALADPTRRAILARLARGRSSVAELAEPFAMSQPAISKHLKVLETRRPHLDRPECPAPPPADRAAPLAEANAWIEGYRQFWERRYSALDELLGQLQAAPPKSKRKRH